MSKHIRKSKIKVNGALTVFNKTINKILEANKVLEEGVALAKKNHDDTCTQIINLENMLDEYSSSITHHEAEIKKNNNLLEKLQGLTK